jgi:hypothetical protein
MSKHDVAKLACRIMAIWVFVQLAVDLTVTMTVTTSLVLAGETRHVPQLLLSALSLLPVATRNVVGVLLWRKADFIASRMTADIADNDAAIDTRCSSADILQIALPLIGFLILTTGLSHLAAFISIALRSSELSASPWTERGLFSTILIFALATWLILGSRGIANTITRLRNHVTKSDQETL